MNSSRPCDRGDGPGADAAAELPIDGMLDLHTFHPSEIGDLIPEYLALCSERGISEVRIVHGKGSGQLRRGVHAILDRLPEVASYRLAPGDRGAWGATLVQLASDGGGQEEPVEAAPSSRPLLESARGALMLALLCAHTTLWGAVVLALALARVLVPSQRWRRLCSPALTAAAEGWIATNNLAMRALLRVRWDVSGLEGLVPQRSYLVCSNHQSWTDIVVLQKILHRRIPFQRFFLKQELIWVPILGMAWWALDFPFMKRYSREYLEKRPDKRGADLEATRRSCERLRDVDLSITNFLEGTRLTDAKHASQQSPYRNLLKPRAGGVAFVIGALGGKLAEMVDVTIVYPHGAPTMWGFLSGRVPRIVVDVRLRAIPAELRGGRYESDALYRQRAQEWVREIWAEKDELIERLRESGASPPARS